MVLLVPTSEVKRRVPNPANAVRQHHASALFLYFHGRVSCLFSGTVQSDKNNRRVQFVGEAKGGNHKHWVPNPW